MMKKVGFMTLALSVAITCLTFAAGGHYKVGSDWQIGAAGTYVVVQDGTNRVLVEQPLTPLILNISGLSKISEQIIPFVAKSMY